MHNFYNGVSDNWTTTYFPCQLPDPIQTPDSVTISKMDCAAELQSYKQNSETK